MGEWPARVTGVPVGEEFVLVAMEEGATRDEAKAALRNAGPDHLPTTFEGFQQQVRRHLEAVRAAA